ncbi:MAG TPA: ABC transporter ATP-binding protein [Candidatus Saccharimonadales bacterium]|nr:ABC transporter ATP-binding protein [Candidatus Saccharimonadales bacterium]
MSTDLKTLRLYLACWREQPWTTVGSTLIGIGYILQNIITPLFVAKALGQLTAHHNVQASVVWYAGLALLGGISIGFVGDRVFSAPRASRSVASLYNRCFQYLMSQDYDFFSNNFSGSLVTQANRFVKGFEVLDGIFFIDVLGPYTGVLIALGIMIAFNPALGITIALLWAAALWIVGRLVVQRMPMRRKAVAKESQQTGELADSVTNAVAVKTFAHEQFEAERFNATNQERSRLLLKSWSLAIRNSISIQIMCGILQLAVLGGGIYAVTHHTMSLATFLLFQLFVLRIIDSIAKSSLLVRQFEGMLGDAHEMTLLLEQKPHIQDIEHPRPLHIKKGAIAFQDVAFTYDKDQKHSQELFAKLDMDVLAGQRIGLVGPSGGGKSTITRLLLRFHEVQAGRILVDGQDIREVPQAELRKHIAYVPQEPLLFHRSIRENIAYGRPDATEAEIITASKRAHAHDFIENLPNGYDTLVGERGVKLSGGQRQRVAIARAILKNAPILVLDEATSALDSESEMLIQDALWRLMENRTALVIAHRLSTVQKMDRIVVLKKGKIAEQGTHKELLAKKGVYAKLWAHQSGGFIED